MAKTPGAAVLTLASLLTASAAQAQKVPVVIDVDPNVETKITVQPFASTITKQAPAPSDLKGKTLVSCSASTTSNGVSDHDCDLDW